MPLASRPDGGPRLRPAFQLLVARRARKVRRLLVVDGWHIFLADRRSGHRVVGAGPPGRGRLAARPRRPRGRESSSASQRRRVSPGSCCRARSAGPPGLGLGEELEAGSSSSRRVDARRCPGGAFSTCYAHVITGAFGWGVLAARSSTACGADEGAGVAPTGVEVAGLTARLAVAARRPTAGDLGPFDLVIGADGARVRVSGSASLAKKDVGYPYGAICRWCPIRTHRRGRPSPGYRGTQITFRCCRSAWAGVVLLVGPDARSLRPGRRGPRVGRPRATAAPASRRPLMEPAATEGSWAPGLGTSLSDGRSSRPTPPGLVLLGDAARAMSRNSGSAVFGCRPWALAACLRGRPATSAGALRAHAGRGRPTSAGTRGPLGS